MTEPPAILGREYDTELAALAAFCRELQRNTGERPFTCPVNIVQRLMRLRFDTVANRLLAELEDEDVIKCVERGAPNLLGKKGKATLWRYLYPME
jgi:hypothetical protein